MSRYTIRHEHLGPWPVVAMIDTTRGTTARLARRGATLLEYQVPLAERLHNLADGFATAEALEELKGAHFAIMCPFANRVADARYDFAGATHDLAPAATGPDRHIMHGFVRASDFDLVAVDADAAGASVRLQSAAIRPETWPGYPFAIDLELVFTLHPGGLDLAATVHNVGDTDAPCFVGWHPYLRLREDGVDELELKLPAAQAIMTDEALIPLAGAAAFKPLDAYPELDFRDWQRIGPRVLDNGFAGRRDDADGRLRTHLRDPASGLGVAMWQESGVTQVFTGDTLAPAMRRRSVAIEPMQAMTDAFNRPDCAEAITLAAGASREFHCGLEVHLP
jgi:aldose 1-epimerase